MAGDRIVVRTDLWEHPKTKRAAATLGVPSREMGDLLVHLFAWVRKFYPDGDLGGVEPREIARDGAGYQGPPDKFVGALLTCGFGPKRPGFLAREGRGPLRVHNWTREQAAMLDAEQAREHAVDAADRMRKGAARGGKARARKSARAPAPLAAPLAAPLPDAPAPAAQENDVKVKVLVRSEVPPPREGEVGQVKVSSTSVGEGRPSLAAGGGGGAPALAPSPHPGSPVRQERPTATSTDRDRPEERPTPTSTDLDLRPENATETAGTGASGGRAAPTSGEKSPPFAQESPQGVPGVDRAHPGACAPHAQEAGQGGAFTTEAQRHGEPPAPAPGVTPSPRAAPSVSRCLSGENRAGLDEFSVQYAADGAAVVVAAREASCAYVREDVAVECARRRGEEAVAWIVTAAERAERKRRDGHTGTQDWTRFVEAGILRKNPRFENGGTPHDWAVEKARRLVREEEQRLLGLAPPEVRRALAKIGGV